MKGILMTILMLSVVLFACDNKTKPNIIKEAKPVKFTHFQERQTMVVSTVKYEGFIIGADFDREEVYIQAYSQLDRNYALLIVSILTGEVKKEMKLVKGGFDGPTDFYNPSYMQFVNGYYIIVDQYHKIMVYDEKLNYLYTNMFYVLRYFIDFFPMDKKFGFVIGETFNGLEFNMNFIRLFCMQINKKPTHIRDLYAFKFNSLGLKNRKSREYSFKGSIWPSGRGFEKDGKIYFANYNEKNYYVFDLKTTEMTSFYLDYIKPKIFSQKDVEKLAYLYSDGSLERILKKSGKKRAVEHYPDPIYHFGVFDVGKKKIGIIGDLDINNFTFRLDILDAVSGTYLMSIRLPFGDGLLQSISTSARGLHPLYFDIDKGYYLWNNAEGEDLIDKTQITRFRILGEENRNPAKVK